MGIAFVVISAFYYKLEQKRLQQLKSRYVIPILSQNRKVTKRSILKPTKVYNFSNDPKLKGHFEFLCLTPEEVIGKHTFFDLAPTDWGLNRQESERFMLKAETLSELFPIDCSQWHKSYFYVPKNPDKITPEFLDTMPGSVITACQKRINAAQSVAEMQRNKAESQTLVNKMQLGSILDSSLRETLENLQKIANNTQGNNQNDLPK